MRKLWSLPADGGNFAAHPLRDKDVIELAGVKMEFVNPAATVAA